MSGTLAESGAPVGIQEVDGSGRTLPDGAHRDVNRVTTQAVLPPGIAAAETAILETVVQDGTGRAASTGQFAAGKTGTTSNYGDAWFVGWDSRYTVAVWVGYPNGLVPMTTAFNGNPVLGGTYPALIWHNFITFAMRIDKERAERAASKHARSSSAATGEAEPEETLRSRPAATKGGSGSGGSGGARRSSPSQHSAGSSAPSGAGGQKRTGGGAEGGAAPESAPRAPSAPAPTPKAAPPPSSPPAEPPPATGGVSPGGG